MSNYANRNAKQPDVSPKRKQDFSVRDRTIAIILLAAFLGGISLAIGAFSVSNNASVEEIKRELKITKQAQDKAYDQKLADLFAKDQARVAKLDAREAALNQREAKLLADIKAREDALAAEKDAFYATQARIRELSGALYDELSPDE